MANVRAMYTLFDVIDGLKTELASGDAVREQLLEQFVIRLFSVLDGVEGPDVKWRGIAMVAREDLPDSVPEINDQFLHDAWSER